MQDILGISLQDLKIRIFCSCDWTMCHINVWLMWQALPTALVLAGSPRHIARLASQATQATPRTQSFGLCKAWRIHVWTGFDRALVEQSGWQIYFWSAKVEPDSKLTGFSWIKQTYFSIVHLRNQPGIGSADFVGPVASFWGIAAWALSWSNTFTNCNMQNTCVWSALTLFGPEVEAEMETVETETEATQDCVGSWS